MLNNVKVYTVYHDESFVEQFNLCENEWMSLYYTKAEDYRSLNHLQQFFNEFTAMFYVLRNVDYKLNNFIGFQHYRRTWASEFIKNTEENKTNLIESNFKVFGNYPWGGCIDWFMSSRYRNFLYDDLKEYTKLNYSPDSRIYKIFIEDAYVERKWLNACVYVTKVEYFEEIVSYLYNFVIYINDKYNLDFNYDKYKLFIEENWIANVDFDSLGEGEFWMGKPDSNKYRIFAYMFEVLLGYYFSYINDENYE